MPLDNSSVNKNIWAWSKGDLNSAVKCNISLHIESRSILPPHAHTCRVIWLIRYPRLHRASQTIQSQRTEDTRHGRPCKAVQLPCKCTRARYMKADTISFIALILSGVFSNCTTACQHLPNSWANTHQKPPPKLPVGRRTVIQGNGISVRRRHHRHKAAMRWGFTQTIKTVGLYLESQGPLSLYKVCMCAYVHARRIKVRGSEVNRRWCV